MSETKSTKTVDAFTAPGVGSVHLSERSERFTNQFPVEDAYIKKLELGRQLEIWAAYGSPSKEAEVEAKYNKAFEDIATKIVNKGSRKSSKKKKNIICAMANNVKDVISKHKDTLLKQGFIAKEHNPVTCLVCGKSLCTGDLFLRTEDGSSDSVCIGCCSFREGLSDETGLYIKD